MMLQLILLSFCLSFILSGALIVWLKKINLQQTERAEGPESHKAKSGTPTMGGLAFVLVAAVLSFLYVDAKYFPLVFLFLGYAFIGLLDDLIKVFKARNLGLTFWQKIFSQVFISLAFVLYLIIFGDLHPNLFFAVFIIVGCANAANLTDGLDGLLAGSGIISFLAFAIIAFREAYHGGAMFCVIFVGVLLGFLFYNFPKAKVFMGDTGSLAIGAALSGFAVIGNYELLLAIVCGVFLIEALSVIIQVGSYKLFKKRIFKMAPLHHHFELLGWSEFKTVLFFWAVQMFFCLLGVIIS